MTKNQSGSAPDPSTAVTREDLTRSLQALKEQSGRSFRDISDRSHKKESGIYSISHGTAQNVATKNEPKESSVRGFVIGCGLTLVQSEIWINKLRELYPLSNVAAESATAAQNEHVLAERRIDRDLRLTEEPTTQVAIRDGAATDGTILDGLVSESAPDQEPAAYSGPDLAPESSRGVLGVGATSADGVESEPVESFTRSPTFGVHYSSQGLRRPIAVVLLVTVITALVTIAVTVLPGSSALPSAVFSQPAGTTAPHVFTVDGRLSGWRETDEIWVATQALGDYRVHPTEAPAAVHKGHFSVPEYYLGQVGDTGRQFRLLVILVHKGSPAQEALQQYAARPKDQPDSYAGLPSVPRGALVLAEKSITRS